MSFTIFSLSSSSSCSTRSFASSAFFSDFSHIETLLVKIFGGGQDSNLPTAARWRSLSPPQVRSYSHFTLLINSPKFFATALADSPWLWQRRYESNIRIRESKSLALPLGDTAMVVSFTFSRYHYRTEKTIPGYTLLSNIFARISMILFTRFCMPTSVYPMSLPIFQ